MGDAKLQSLLTLQTTRLYLFLHEYIAGQEKRQTNYGTDEHCVEYNAKASSRLQYDKGMPEYFQGIIAQKTELNSSK